MPEFKLLIDRLTSAPQRFDFEATAAWWHARAGLGEAPGEGTVDGPLRFSLAASRVGEGVLIEGSFAGTLSAECSRCTRRYAHALRDDFRLVLEPMKEELRGDARGEVALDPEAERSLAGNGMCLGDDLEAGWFRGPVIFVDDFLGEVVALAMPIQPLCDEGCLGLCPQCGMERRSARTGGEEDLGCQCADVERVESPFAVLAGLKDRVGPRTLARPEGSEQAGQGRGRPGRRGGPGNRN